ncbi:transposase [Geodermatophilus sp. SYSU D00700]
MGRVSQDFEHFRRQAAMLVVDGGRSVRDVALELDVDQETLRNGGRCAQAGAGHARWAGQGR